MQTSSTKKKAKEKNLRFLVNNSLTHTAAPPNEMQGYGRKTNDINVKSIKIYDRLLVDAKGNITANNISIDGQMFGGDPVIYLRQSDIDAAGGIYNVSVSGSYIFGENLAGGLLISAGNVCIDMANMSLSPGANGTLVGFDIESTNNVVIKNGVVSGGFACGIQAVDTYLVDILDVQVLDTFVSEYRAAPAPLVSPNPATITPATPATPATTPETPATTPETPATTPATPTTTPATPATTPARPTPFSSYVPSAARLAKKNTRPARQRVSTTAWIPLAKMNLSQRKTYPAPAQVPTNPMPATVHAAIKSKGKFSKSNFIAAQMQARKASRAAGTRPNYGPRNGVPYAGIYIENCASVGLYNVSCSNNQEVCILLTETEGFVLDKLDLSDGNRALSIIACSSGVVNNVQAYNFSNNSSWDTASIIEFNECSNVDVTNVIVTNCVKALNTETFDGNSGIVSLLGCETVNLSHAQISFNSQSGPWNYASFSPLLILSCDNCNLSRVLCNQNYRDNNSVLGGYIESTALMYCTSISFTDCEANYNNIINGGESGIDGWLCVIADNVCFKNCSTSFNYIDTGSNVPFIGGITLISVDSFIIDGCQIQGMSVNSADATGQTIGISVFPFSEYGPCLGGQITNTLVQQQTNFYSDTEDPYTPPTPGLSYGIEAVAAIAVNIDNCSIFYQLSQNDDAIGIQYIGCADCLITNTVSGGNWGNGVTYGINLSGSSNCTIKNCNASDNWSDSDQAAGIYIDGCSQIQTFDCVCNNNSGSSFSFGVALNSNCASCSVTKCVVIGNASDEEAGFGVAIWSSDGGNAQNCVVKDCDSGANADYGFADNSEIPNSWFGNTAESDGFNLYTFANVVSFSKGTQSFSSTPNRWSNISIGE